MAASAAPLAVRVDLWVFVTKAKGYLSGMVVANEVQQ